MSDGISLPTPYAVINSFCIQPDAQQILPAYEQAMVGEVARIAAAIAAASFDTGTRPTIAWIEPTAAIRR